MWSYDSKQQKNKIQITFSQAVQVFWPGREQSTIHKKGNKRKQNKEKQNCLTVYQERRQPNKIQLYFVLYLPKELRKNKKIKMFLKKEIETFKLL